MNKQTRERQTQTTSLLMNKQINKQMNDQANEQTKNNQTNVHLKNYERWIISNFVKVGWNMATPDRLAISVIFVCETNRNLCIAPCWFLLPSPVCPTTVVVD